MLVGKILSRRVIISSDGLMADGYLEKALPIARRVSFGYGKVVQWDFPLTSNLRKMTHQARPIT
jgi:hypothetical protein